jgi:hypothetical protein
MNPPRFTEVERRGDVWCVRIRVPRLDEPEMVDLAEELYGLVRDGGCRKMALSLGPTPPEFLYSVFLSKLIRLRRLLHEQGGELVLCHASSEVQSIFEACSLDTLFRFLPDFDAAVAHWQA